MLMERTESKLFEFEVSGDYAMFADPMTKAGGERLSFQVPTYEAIKGILHSIYWKPTLTWIVHSVRVMNRIQTETLGIKNMVYSGGNDLSFNTYLRKVRYQVRAFYVWNMNRPEYEVDRIFGKHDAIIERMIRAGGRRDVFLGSRECQGYVEPAAFGEGKGYYDSSGKRLFGFMYHGVTYPDEALLEEDKGMMSVRFWSCYMDNGVISFPKPEDCPEKRHLKKMEMKNFHAMEGSGVCELDS